MIERRDAEGCQGLVKSGVEAEVQADVEVVVVVRLAASQSSRAAWHWVREASACRRTQGSWITSAAVIRAVASLSSTCHIREEA